MGWKITLGLAGVLASSAASPAFGQRNCNPDYERYLSMPVQAQQAFLRAGPLRDCLVPRNPQLLQLDNSFIRRTYEQQLSVGEHDPFTDAVLSPDSTAVLTPNTMYIVQKKAKLPWESNRGADYDVMIVISSNDIVGSRRLDSTHVGIEVCRKTERMTRALQTLERLLRPNLQAEELASLRTEVEQAALEAPRCVPKYTR